MTTTTVVPTRFWSAFRTVQRGDELISHVPRDKVNVEFWVALEPPLLCDARLYPDFAQRLQRTRTHFSTLSICNKFIPDTHMYGIYHIQSNEWWWMSHEDKARIVLALIFDGEWGIFHDLAISDIPPSVRLMMLYLIPGEFDIIPGWSIHYQNKAHYAARDDLDLDRLSQWKKSSTIITSGLTTEVMIVMAYIYVNWFCAWRLIPYDQHKSIWYEFGRLLLGATPLRRINPPYYPGLQDAVCEFQSCIYQLTHTNATMTTLQSTTDFQDPVSTVLMSMLTFIGQAIENFHSVWEQNRLTLKSTYVWRIVPIIRISMEHAHHFLTHKGFHRHIEEGTFLPMDLTSSQSCFTLDQVSQAEWTETHRILERPKPELSSISFFGENTMNDKTLIITNPRILIERSISIYLHLLSVPREQTQSIGDLLPLSPMVCKLISVCPDDDTPLPELAPPLWFQFWHILVNLPVPQTIWDWYRHIDLGMDNSLMALFLLAHVYTQLVHIHWIPVDGLIGLITSYPKLIESHKLLSRLTISTIEAIKMKRLSSVPNSSKVFLIAIQSPLANEILSCLQELVDIAKPFVVTFLKHWTILNIHRPKSFIIPMESWVYTADYTPIAIPMNERHINAPIDLHRALMAIELHFRAPLTIRNQDDGDICFWRFIQLIEQSYWCDPEAVHFSLPVLRSASGKQFYWGDETIPILHSLHDNTLMSDRLYHALTHSPITLNAVQSLISSSSLSPKKSPSSSSSQIHNMIVECPPSPKYD